jgi:hypothetical protein
MKKKKQSEAVSRSEMVGGSQELEPTDLTTVAGVPHPADRRLAKPVRVRMQ